MQDYRPGRESCGYFAWARFDEFGEPPWSADFAPDAQGEGGGGSGCEMLADVRGDEVEEDEDVVVVAEEQEQQQETEQREWSDETVEGSERDFDEDWGDGEDVEIAEELQEWRDGLLR